MATLICATAWGSCRAFSFSAEQQFVSAEQQRVSAEQERGTGRTFRSARGPAGGDYLKLY